MSDVIRDVIFADLGGTVGREVIRVTRGSSSTVLEPYVVTRELFTTLAASARLGILAYGPHWTQATLQAEIDRNQLSQVFDSALTLALRDGSPLGYRTAMQSTGIASKIVFVSGDVTRRRIAQDAGMRPCPHARLSLAVLAGQRLSYVRAIRGEERRLKLAQAQHPFGIMLLRRAPGLESLYAIVSDSVRVELGDAVDVVGLAGGAADSDLIFVRKYDEQPQWQAMEVAGSSRPSRILLVETTNQGWLIQADSSVAPCSLHSQTPVHDHGILCAPESPAPMMLVAGATEIPPVPSRDLELGERNTIANLGGLETANDLAGLCAFGRDVAEEGNGYAVTWLQQRLLDIFPQVTLLPFTYKDATLNNVSAEIAGSETTNEIVVVGAHLDSVATDGGKAAGADDDASGCVAVLAIARALAKLGQPKRSIRFLLFNAEETPIAGSLKYTDDLVATHPNERVVAMLQLDMVGFVAEGAPTPRRCEIHGISSAEPKDIGVPEEKENMLYLRTSELVAIVNSCVDPLVLQPQLIPNDDPCKRTRTVSDHRAFLARAWPACLLAEDLHGDDCSDISMTNKNYHSSKDAQPSLSIEHLEAIARVAAQAIWKIANGPTT